MCHTTLFGRWKFDDSNFRHLLDCPNCGSIVRRHLQFEMLQKLWIRTDRQRYDFKCITSHFTHQNDYYNLIFLSLIEKLASRFIFTFFLFFVRQRSLRWLRTNARVCLGQAGRAWCTCRKRWSIDSRANRTNRRRHLDKRTKTNQKGTFQKSKLQQAPYTVGDSSSGFPQ